MKKLALLFFLLLFLCELLYLDYQYIDTKPVNGYIDVHEQDSRVKYNLLCDKISLNSNNFLEYMKDVSVIAIVIEIPELLNRKLIPTMYYFDYHSTEQNLKRISNEYSKTLRKYNFMKEYYRVQYSGITIREVMVEITEEHLKGLLDKYPNIRVELTR